MALLMLTAWKMLIRLNLNISSQVCTSKAPEFGLSIQENSGRNLIENNYISGQSAWNISARKGSI